MDSALHTVGDIMTPNPVVVGPTNSVAKAIRLMRQHAIRRLPVVENGRLVGIVTSGDLRRITGLASILNDKSQDNFLWHHIPVVNVMSPNPITVAPTASASEVAAILIEHKIGGVPVLDGDELVGIITSTDLLRYMIRLESAVGRAT
ncbi:MAG: CBS domain-containing protein [Caldilineales bacterium]|nr:CBS domain-containing protein [Caldilineales bacterium]MDW8317029.1 CBS domain-containing protein [Anaerolineae bacterium]